MDADELQVEMEMDISPIENLSIDGSLHDEAAAEHDTTFLTVPPASPEKFLSLGPDFELITEELYTNREAMMAKIIRNKGQDLALEICDTDGKSLKLVPCHLDAVGLLSRTFYRNLNAKLIFAKPDQPFQVMNDAEDGSEAVIQVQRKVILHKDPFEGLSEQVLEHFLSFAYTGKVDLSLRGFDEVLQLLVQAAQQRVWPLIEDCAEFLLERISIYTAVQLVATLRKLKEGLKSDPALVTPLLEKHKLARRSRSLRSKSSKSSNSSIAGQTFVAAAVATSGGVKDGGEAQETKIRLAALNSAVLDFIMTHMEDFLDCPTARSTLVSLDFQEMQILLQDDRLDVQDEHRLVGLCTFWADQQVGYTRSGRASTAVRHLDRLNFLLPLIRAGRFAGGVQQIDQTYYALKELYGQGVIKLDWLREARLQLTMQQSTLRHDARGLPARGTTLSLRPRIPFSVPFILGGWVKSVPSVTAEALDTQVADWSRSDVHLRSRLPHPFTYHGMEVLNGHVWLVGGTDGLEIFSHLFRLDPVSGKLTQMADMGSRRCYVATGVIDGKLYACGGHTGHMRTNTVECYDPETNTWSTVAEMHVARSDAAASVWEGKLYVAGGINDISVERTVECYDPETNSWTLISSMISQRTSFKMVVFRGALWALGGNDGNARLNSTECYKLPVDEDDEQAGEPQQWVAGPEMLQKRSTFAAVVQPRDQSILVIGGYDGRRPVGACEEYVPDDEEEVSVEGGTGEWREAPSLVKERSGHGAVVLSGLPNVAEYTFHKTETYSPLRTAEEEEAREYNNRRWDARA